MDSEIQRRIEEAVRRILESSDMDEMTESKIRALASKDLDLDLSKSPYKTFVRNVVESFLQERSEEQPQDQPEDVSAAKEKEYDDGGDLIVCWVCFFFFCLFFFPVACDCNLFWLLVGILRLLSSDDCMLVVKFENMILFGLVIKQEEGDDSGF